MYTRLSIHVYIIIYTCIHNYLACIHIYLIMYIYSATQITHIFVIKCCNESPALLLSLTPNCREGYNSQFGGFAWVVRDFLYNILESNRRQAILFIYIYNTNTEGDCNGSIYIYICYLCSWICIRFLPLSALKLMYFSLINSHLQFCVATWGFDHSRINKLQKKAIRVMCNARYNAHTDPLFKENKILKIRDIFNLNCLKLYHKYKNQELPNFFNNMFTTNADIHSYHTRRRNDLHYFSYNTEGASKRIRHTIPNIINELTPLVREKLSTLNLEQFTNY